MKRLIDRDPATAGHRAGPDRSGSGAGLNRRAVVLAGLAALPAALGTLPGSAAAKRGGSRKRRPAKPKPVAKVVTRTFASTQLITTPARGTASPYPSTILVSGLTSGRTQKVSVTLDGISHAFPNDLDVLVVAPDGRAVVVMSDLGGGGAATGVTLTFDDQALGSPPLKLVTGVYLPTNVVHLVDTFPLPAPAVVLGAALSDFNGGNPNGLWSLYVVDDTNPDAGTIRGWSLTIQAQIKAKPKPRRKPQRKGRANGDQRPKRRQAK